VWAWGIEGGHYDTSFGHGEQMDCPLPKPIEALRGIKVGAAVAGDIYTLALAEPMRACSHGVTGMQQEMVLSASALH
jgi:hypothetical protein